MWENKHKPIDETKILCYWYYPGQTCALSIKNVYKQVERNEGDHQTPLKGIAIVQF